jgi:hypothetical protein
MKHTWEVWLFITRAQPWLHKWHLDAIKQAIDNEWLSKVIIWIGSSDKEYTTENPFTSAERKELIEKTTQEIKDVLWNDIFLIPDFWDWNKWMNYILNNLPEFDYIIWWQLDPGCRFILVHKWIVIDIFLQYHFSEDLLDLISPRWLFILLPSIYYNILYISRCILRPNQEIIY